MDLAEMTAALFARHLNSAFRLQMAPDHVIEMKLTEVTEKGSSPEIESFALHFLAPTDAPPHQGNYRMTHDALGEFELFVVPVGRDQRGVEFQAVFNRLKNK